jgi:hypothetical protein
VKARAAKRSRHDVSAIVRERTIEACSILPMEATRMTSLATPEQKHRLGRSIKVRRVFAELRLALGSDIPAGELLRFAAWLVDATSPIEPRDEHPSAGLRPAFDQLPLDKAFRDGGWSIMAGELRRAGTSSWDDDPGFAVKKRGFVS